MVRIDNIGFGSGTGTIVAVDDAGRGLILTCAHLFLGRIGGQVDVRYADGAAGKATLAEIDKEADLAALEIDGAAGRASVPVADAWPGPGAAVIQYGYPQETAGRMNRRAGRVRSYLGGQLTLDMRVDHGDSGSAVVAAGRVIGVVSAKPIDSTPLAYCTGLDAIRRFLSRFRDRFRNRNPPRPDPPPPPRTEPPPPPRPDTDPGGLLPRLHDRLGGIGDRLRALEEGARLLPEVNRRLEDLDRSGRKLDQLGEGMRRLQALEKLQDLAKLKDLAGGAAAIEGKLAILPWIVGGTATGGSLLAGLLGYWAVRRGLGGLAGGLHGLVAALRQPSPTPAASPAPAAAPSTVVVEAAAAPPATTRYVGVPAADARLAALNAALDHYARRYPGNLDFVQTVQAFADQYQSGQQAGRR